MSWLDTILGWLRPKPTPTPTAITPAAIVAALNAERARAGLLPVAEFADLDRAAAEGAAMMARTGIFHIGFSERSYAYRPGRSFGEVAAEGQTSVEQVVEGWMNSPGHRSEILNPAYRQAGAGTALKGRTIWWCADFSS